MKISWVKKRQGSLQFVCTRHNPPECVSIVIVVGVACLSTALRPLAATAVAVAAVAVAGVDDFVDVLVEFDGEPERERKGERV